MKELLKKYWYVLLIILILPIGLNFALRFNSPVGIIGNTETWLAFWSTYSASLLGSLITLYVLFRTLAQNEKSLSKTLVQNEANNKETKQLQISIYQKGLEERRIQELAQTFKESLHFIDILKVYHNRDLIKKQKYDEPKLFFDNELNRCLNTLSSYSLDYISTDNNSKIKEYQSIFQETLNFYLPTLQTALRIISTLKENSLNDKQVRFEYLFEEDKNPHFFTEKERYLFLNSETETQYLNISLITLNRRIDTLLRVHIKKQKLLIKLSNEIISDKLKKLDSFDTFST